MTRLSLFFFWHGYVGSKKFEWFLFAGTFLAFYSLSVPFPAPLDPQILPWSFWGFPLSPRPTDRPTGRPTSTRSPLENVSITFTSTLNYAEEGGIGSGIRGRNEPPNCWSFGRQHDCSLHIWVIWYYSTFTLKALKIMHSYIQGETRNLNLTPSIGSQLFYHYGFGCGHGVA